MLFAIGSDESDRTESDLFIDSGRVAVAAGGAGSIAVKRWDALSPSLFGKINVGSMTGTSHADMSKTDFHYLIRTLFYPFCQRGAL